MTAVFKLRWCLILLIFSVVSGTLVNGPIWGTGNLQRLVPGVTIPDLTFGYSAHELPGFFQAMGAEGRAAYMTVNNLDFLFIFSYLTFGFVVFGTLLSRLIKNKTLAHRLAFLGLLPGLFDLIETSIFRIIVSAPDKDHERLSQVAAPITNAKFVAVNVSLIILVLLLAVAVYRAKKGKNE